MSKSAKVVLVPLPEPASALLAVQPRRAGRDLIFGTRASRGFQNWHKCKLALDQRIAAARGGRLLDDWVLHDFRRVVSTRLHEKLGVPPHVVEAILGHADGHQRGVAGVYNKALYLDERRRALARWSGHLAAIVTGAQPAATVVQLRR